MELSVLCKVLGAALVVLCGWGTGRAFCRRTVCRRRTLAQTTALLQRLREEIGYRKTDLTQLYRRMADNPAYASLGLLQSQSFQSLAPPAVFTAEEQALFRECFQQLGRTMAEQECAQLDFYILRFEQAGRQAAEAEAQAGRLYGRLGLGIGAMAAILLL